MAYKNKADERAKESRRKHYRNNKEAYYRNNQIKKLKMYEFVDGLKQVPCKDCDQTFPPCAMDFDHLEGYKKIRTVSSMINYGSWKKLKEEIEKCEIVCSNCHRIRTSKRLGYR